MSCVVPDARRPTQEIPRQLAAEVAGKTRLSDRSEYGRFRSLKKKGPLARGSLLRWTGRESNPQEHGG